VLFARSDWFTRAQEIFKFTPTCDKPINGIEGKWPYMQHYLSGKEFGMVPVVAEDYGYGTMSYYAVAVVKRTNTDIQFNKLEGKKTCHTGAGKTAGWNVPVGTLLSMKSIKSDPGCNSYVAAGKYFKESCVPSK